MFDQDPDLDNALASRRIPHGRSRQRNNHGRSGGGGASTAVFDPLRALGLYDVSLGPKSASKFGSSSAKSKLQKRENKNQKKNQKQSKLQSSSSKTETVVQLGTETEAGVADEKSWLELHELTPNEDGFVGSFEFNGNTTTTGANVSNTGRHATRVRGMCVLAGSRKGLAEIIRGLEEEDEETPEQHEVREGDGEVYEEREEKEEDNDDDDEVEDDDDDDEQSTLELEDAKINRRARAFEKNTFRNPKFWMRWRGHIDLRMPQHVSDSNSRQSFGRGAAAEDKDRETENKQEVVDESGTEESEKGTEKGTERGGKGEAEINTAYIIFSNNSCDKFEGTISCESLGWDNLRIQGRKIKSKGSRCRTTWADFP